MKMKMKEYKMGSHNNTMPGKPMQGKKAREYANMMTMGGPPEKKPKGKFKAP